MFLETLTGGIPVLSGPVPTLKLITYQFDTSHSDLIILSKLIIRRIVIQMFAQLLHKIFHPSLMAYRITQGIKK